jgi:hypothetical protein
MGNVFQRFGLGTGLISAAALFLAACSGDGASEDTPGAVIPPYSGDALAQPNTPAPNTDTPATSGSEQPSGVATPPSNSEGPPAGSNTPVAPPPQNTDTGTDTATPPEQTPPQTPPEQTPEQTPPQQPPPDQTPPQQPPPAGRTQVFLLFGQSNMWGVPNPQQQDLAINPRVEVLTITNCSKHGTNQWVPAQPPLHGCVGQPGTGGQGPGVGPGDYFGKTIADAFPNDTILLVPAAVPGVSIDTFQPGQTNYNNLLNRARMAQQRGEIRGMIFHQGESDAGNTSTWPARVKNVVDRLRSDLNAPNAPFVAGELLPSGCCGGMNAVIDGLPNTISRAAVAKADASFRAVPASQDMYGNLHFDVVAQREFGKRYGQAMLGLLGNN